ncbi:EamA family transporter RarD [Pullulanibacillus sp. KACC 23026]|uniref:EamA family transporter RarD n=1 Tax=Pullulanibacillus sp. KACC 23026 TaxID=3028315 RepID=UPI0023B2006D|nr:EamA family transporter RarD [Pullulanibacillus sp. KACC 23026]WEG11829.1 EamA family transporter RarD [Pullulanibacillus sp. KACC 23026]
METQEKNDQVLGGLAAAGSYIIWGIMPIYWKLIIGATPTEVLAHRMIWSFVFMILVLLVTRKMGSMFTDIKALLLAPKRLVIIMSASIFITINWYTFIWAVNNGHIIQSSLGYYINPLVSVLLGILFLKERLSLWQIVSCILALVGVVFLALEAGTFPWISLTLAFSFGIYGLLKKIVKLPAMSGLTIETLIITPFALIYLLGFDPTAGQSFNFQHLSLALYLMGAGVVTAIPLLLFAAGANRISLAMIGFFQYIAPTLMLILGTLLYHEPFDSEHLFSFILIWVALVIFTLARTSLFKKAEAKLLHRPIQKVS